MTSCHACLAQANRYAPGTHAHANNLARAAKDMPTRQVAGLDVHLSCASQVEYLLSDERAFRVSPDGVVTWISNDRVLFDDAVSILITFGAASGASIDACRTAQHAQDIAFAAAYRRNQPAQPSAEEMYEMRAAFGPGQTVVDAVSGRTVRT